MTAWPFLFQTFSLLIAGLLGFLSVSLGALRIMQGAHWRKSWDALEFFFGGATLLATLVYMGALLVSLSAQPLSLLGPIGLLGAVSFGGHVPEILSGFLSVCSLLGAMGFIFPWNVEPPVADLRTVP